MQTFDSAGVSIAYLEEGAGRPVLLVHGFASNVRINWINPGWVAALTKSGRRVVAFDHRGHGESGKLYDPLAYSIDAMAKDAVRLLDHVDVEAADIVGYSMGARVAARMALAAPGRVRTVSLCGAGMNLVTGMRNEEAVAEALLAEDAGSVKTEPGRSFRRFADRTHSDRKALAACILSPRVAISAAELARLRLPVLVAHGATDNVATEVAEMASLIPGAELLEIPDRDHMTVVGDKRLISGVIDFLDRHA